jgi:Flp pilus assembly protein TadB
MLSRDHSRRLAQMERQLWREDPEFCSRMEANQPEPGPRRRPPLALILSAAVIWVVALVLGVAGWWIAAAIAALCATVLVTVLAVRQARQRHPVERLLDPQVPTGFEPEQAKPEQRRPEQHGPDDHPEQSGGASPRG